jgi:hypothetical protein
MIIETERRSIRPHSVKDSYWKRPCTCHKTDYGMIEYIYNLCVRACVCVCVCVWERVALHGTDKYRFGGPQTLSS